MNYLKAASLDNQATALDGFGLVFAITLFFCLIQSAHDGIAKRNRAHDKDRWWYPICRLVEAPSSAVARNSGSN
jgi:hypothetical protein